MEEKKEKTLKQQIEVFEWAHNCYMSIDDDDEQIEFLEKLIEKIEYECGDFNLVDYALGQTELLDKFVEDKKGMYDVIRCIEDGADPTLGALKWTDVVEAYMNE